MYLQYVEVLIQRKNSLTNTLYKNDGTVFAWELINEARLPQDMSGDTLQVCCAGCRRSQAVPKTDLSAPQSWIEDVSGAIKAMDPNHMVTTGSEVCSRIVSTGFSSARAPLTAFDLCRASSARRRRSTRATTPTTGPPRARTLCATTRPTPLTLPQSTVRSCLALAIHIHPLTPLPCLCFPAHSVPGPVATLLV